MSESHNKDSNFSRVSQTKNFHKLKSRANFSIIGTVIAVVWLLFTVPVVFYHLQQQVEANITPSNDSAIANISVQNCSVHFSRSESTELCSPVCGEWKEFSREEVIVFAFAKSIQYLLHVIGVIITLSVSCYNHKIMFTFPAVLLVYYMVSPILLDVEFLIRLIGQDKLFCSSKDLLYVLEHSTAYCYFSGMLSSFVFSLIGYLWFFLAAIIFWQVWFPISARKARLSGYTKYMHIAVVALCFILSTVPAIAALGSGGYVIPVFPSFLNRCYPKNLSAIFYPYIFVFCITLPIGSTFNLLTLWKILSLGVGKHQGSNLRAECKLLVFFFFFAFTNALSILFFIIGLRNASQNQQGFMDYFACEALGQDPEDPCIFEVDRRKEQAFTIASYASLAIGPYAILVYAIPIDKVRKKWKTWKNINKKDNFSHTISSS